MKITRNIQTLINTSREALTGLILPVVSAIANYSCIIGDHQPKHTVSGKNIS